MFLSSGIRALDLRAMATDGASGAQGAKITEISPYSHPPQPSPPYAAHHYIPPPATAEPYRYQYHQPSPPPAPTVPVPQQQHGYHQGAWYSNSQGYYQPSPPTFVFGSSTYSAPYPQPHTHFSESQANSVIYGPPPSSTYSAKPHPQTHTHFHESQANSVIYGPLPLPSQTSYPFHQYSQDPPLQSSSLPTSASYYAHPPQPNLYQPPQQQPQGVGNSHLFQYQTLSPPQLQDLPLFISVAVAEEAKLTAPPPQLSPHPPCVSRTHLALLPLSPNVHPVAESPSPADMRGRSCVLAMDSLADGVIAVLKDSHSPTLTSSDYSVDSNESDLHPYTTDDHDGINLPLTHQNPNSQLPSHNLNTLQQQESVIFDSALKMSFEGRNNVNVAANEEKPESEHVIDGDANKLDDDAVSSLRMQLGAPPFSSIPSSSLVYSMTGNIRICEKPVVLMGLHTPPTSRVIVRIEHDSLVGITLVNGVRVSENDSPEKGGVMSRTGNRVTLISTIEE